MTHAEEGVAAVPGQLGSLATAPDTAVDLKGRPSCLERRRGPLQIGPCVNFKSRARGAMRKRGRGGSWGGEGTGGEEGRGGRQLAGGRCGHAQIRVLAVRRLFGLFLRRGRCWTGAGG